MSGPSTPAKGELTSGKRSPSGIAGGQVDPKRSIAGHGHLDDGGFDQHLHAPHVQPFHDRFHLGDHGRFAADHDGVQGLVRLDRRGDGAHGLRLRTAAAAGLAVDERLDDLGNLGGIGVPQVDDLGGAGARCRPVELRDQGSQALELTRLALQDQRVVALVGHDRDPARSLGGAADLLRCELLEERGHGADPGLLQLHDLDARGVCDVELPDDAFEAKDVLGVIRDDDDVRFRRGGKVAVLRYQGTQDFQELRRVHVLRGHHPRDQLIAAYVLLLVELRAALACDGLLDHLDDVAGGYGGETVHPQHREEQIVDRVPVETAGRDDRDAPLDARIDDEIPAGDPRDLIDEVADVGILQVDLVGRFRVLGGCRYRRDAWKGHGGEKQQRGQRRTQGIGHGSFIVRVILRAPRWISTRAEPPSSRPSMPSGALRTASMGWPLMVRI
jgi:hypothetical protein